MAWRFRVFFLRFLDYLIHIPAGVWRFVRWLIWIRHPKGKNIFLRWFAGVILLLVDLTPIPFLLECFIDWIKIKTRPLNENEMRLAESVFHSSLPYNLIGVDPASVVVRKKQIIGYVTFHTLNFDRKITDNAFIHELVHIWQYRKHGSAYISESLWAQKWGGGYDYGGFNVIKEHVGAGLTAFNFEQQADIIEEYYRWISGMPLQWSPRLEGMGEILEAYITEVRR